MSSFKSHTPPALTLTEKVGMGLAILNAVRATLQQFITASIYSPAHLPSKAVQAQVAAFRSLLPAVNARQHQANPPSSHSYKSWTEEKAQVEAGYNYAVEDLPGDGVETRLLWIGEPWKNGDKDRKVVLYFHGGGYVLPMGNGHPEWARFLREEVKKYGLDVSVALLEYSLAPTKQYPVQFKQGVLALNHLLAAGCAPGNITLAGDSAGAHLILSILSHVLHPHPDVAPVRPLPAPLAGAILVSPWVTFRITSESFQRGIDYITPELGSYWGDVAMGEGVAERETAEGRHHAQAMLAPESWWEGLNNVVRFVGTTMGGLESFGDDIVEFDRKLRAQSDVAGELYVGEKEVHDGPLIDFMGGRQPSELSMKVAEWIGDGFKAKL